MFKGQRIEITEYERANLLAALYAASGYGGPSPLQIIDNGDWLYQIMTKLGWLGSDTNWGSPNRHAADMVARANEQWMPRDPQ